MCVTKEKEQTCISELVRDTKCVVAVVCETKLLLERVMSQQDCGVEHEPELQPHFEKQNTLRPYLKVVLFEARVDAERNRSAPPVPAAGALCRRLLCLKPCHFNGLQVI